MDGTELLLSPEQWILHLLLNANTVLSLFFFSVRILRVICPFRAPLVMHSPGEGTAQEKVAGSLAVTTWFVLVSIRCVCIAWILHWNSS